MADERDDSIDTLITRALSGEATPAEQQQLNDWMTNPVNAAYFDRAKKAFGLAEQHLAKGKNMPLINVDQEWDQFQDRVGRKPRQGERSLFETTWFRIAAALLVVAVAAFVVNLILSKPDEMRFQTASETLRIELPDGSVVTLNRNSSLAYDGDFNVENRSIRFSGEAFFDITPNKEKPFVISSGEASVEVVGTSFNVSAYEAEEQLIVTVETGVVRLSASSAVETLELRSGEVGILTKASSSLDMLPNTDVNYRSWTTQHVEFKSTSLQEVVRTLNKTYGADISIVGSVSADCVVTVTFDQQTLDAVLRVLETTLNLTYRVNGNKIEITGAKC